VNRLVKNGKKIVRTLKRGVASAETKIVGAAKKEGGKIIKSIKEKRAENKRLRNIK